jgi:hypothetical protein
MPTVANQNRVQLNGPVTTQSREDLDRQRHSRSSSAELTPEPLVFVSQRQRNAVSRREGDDSLEKLITTHFR